MFADKKYLIKEGARKAAMHRKKRVKGKELRPKDGDRTEADLVYSRAGCSMFAID